MINWFFVLLFLAGFAFLAMKVAADKDWKLPFGLAAAGGGAAAWFADFGDKIASWF